VQNIENIINDGVSTENLGSASGRNGNVPDVTLADLKALQQAKETERKRNWNNEQPKKKHPKEDAFGMPKKNGAANRDIFDNKWIYNATDERLPQWSGSIQNEE